ncbi:60S ribosomal protein L15 [Tulasnella sp. 403]|nr:60S ribosomal protein L15 [Tulasnella sp. 403]
MRQTSRPSPEAIALRGSAISVADYFRYAIYSILFLRGVYAIEDFMVINKFDLELLVATNEDLEAYVASVLDQVERTSFSSGRNPPEEAKWLIPSRDNYHPGWLASKSIKQLVLAIVSKESKETLERWIFDVQILDPTPTTKPKSEADFHREVHLMLAGIRGTNSMLSEIQEPTLCNILVYLKDDASDGTPTGESLPDAWEDAHPHAIEQEFATEVKLKHAATSLHKELAKKKQSDIFRFLTRIRCWEYRQLNVIHRATRPSRPDKARRMGYKAKQGYVIYRVRIRRGGRKRNVKKGIVYGKPVHQGVTKLKYRRSLRAVAEQRVGKRCGNLRVLNSYWVGEDSIFKFFEVILIDPSHKAIRRDARINWICAPVHKRRDARALTAAGKKNRGIGRGPRHSQFPRRKTWKRHNTLSLRRYR